MPGADAPGRPVAEVREATGEKAERVLTDVEVLALEYFLAGSPGTVLRRRSQVTARVRRGGAQVQRQDPQGDAPVGGTDA